MLKHNWLCAILLLLLGWQLKAENILVSTDSTKIPDVVLGEIQISASRDNSKIKDIPSSITSLSSKLIENNQILSMEDVATFAPNFMMLDYGTKIMAPVYIRGVGSKKTTVGPSVGLYVDGIPYYDNSALSFDFYDLAKIEILRGPQGTLYGRNTIGGLINIRTLSPMDYQGTNITLSGEQYGVYNATVSHYGKTGERFAYSLSANYHHQDGYFENKGDSTQADEMNSYGLRNRLIFKATDKLSFENIFSLENSKQNGYPYAAYVDSTESLGDVSYNRESGYDRLLINDGLNIKYEEEKWEINTTLAFQNVNDNQKIDQDFKVKDYYFVDQNQNQNLFSFESVARSKSGKKYNWICGVYAMQHYIDKDVTINYYYPINLSVKKDESYKEYAQTNTSAGFFHQSKYSPVKNLFIEAGIRFNYERSKLDYLEQIEYENVVSTNADTAFSPMDKFIILPKIAVSYRFPNSTLYASYATGYKPGGFNSTFEEQDQIKFEKESSDNYEIGFKKDLFDGVLYSDLCFFYSEIKGQQIARSLVSQNGTYLDNTGKSRNKGVEFSLNMMPVNGFEAAISYGYTQSKIVKYQKCDTIDYSGNITPYVPNHTLNITVAQTVNTKAIDFLDNIRFQLNIQEIGNIYWHLSNEKKQDAYSLLNAMISFKYNGIKLDLWGKNLLDTSYNAYMFKSTAWYGQKGLPQRFGATLKVEI